MKRNARVIWNGTGKEGSGTVSTESSVLKEAPYTWKSRYENEPLTNPEELIAAAHASCFSLKLSFVLAEAGVTPERIETSCDITLDNGTISTSHLKTKVKAAGLTEEKLKECVANAEKNCPVSKLLKAEITSEATLG